MKPGRLELHLKLKRSDYVNYYLNYFKPMKEKFTKRSTIKSLYITQAVGVSRTLEVSYDSSFLINKLL